MSTAYAGGNTAARRPTRRSSAHGIRDVDLPQRRDPLDLDAIAAWDKQQERCKDAYHRRPLEKR